MSHDRSDSKPAALPWTFATTVSEARAAVEQPDMNAAAALVNALKAPYAGDPDAKMRASILSCLAHRPVSRDTFRDLLELLWEAREVLGRFGDTRDEIARWLFEHRFFAERAMTPRVAHLIFLAAHDRKNTFERLLLEIIKSGEVAFCEVMARHYLHRDERTLPSGPSVVEALKRSFADPNIPDLGRALAALALAGADAAPERSQVLPLLEGSSFEVHHLAVAALRRADMLAEPEVLRLLERQLEEDFGWEEPDDFEADGLWWTQFEEAAALVCREASADVIEQLASCGRDGRYVSSFGAAGVLAERYPDRAVPGIERHLRAWRVGMRLSAVDLAELLPSEVRLPLLQFASTDPVPKVARRARRMVEDDRREESRLAPASVLPPGVLDAPPSEALLRRLSVVREEAVEPRRQLLHVILGEVRAGRGGPEEAALVALLLCDEKIREGAPDEEGVGDEFVAWVLGLHPLLGEHLSRAVLGLVPRFDPPALNTPLVALAVLHQRGALEAPVLDGVRAHLIGKLSGDAERNRFVLQILSIFGAPASGWEPLYDLLEDDDCFELAQRVLEGAEESPALDERLERDLRAATDPERELRLLKVAIWLGSSYARSRGLELVRACSEEADVRRVRTLVGNLFECGELERDELLRELERPESPRFAFAIPALGPPDEWDERTRASLERAFIGPHPFAAGCVLQIFMERGEMSPDDPRFAEVLGRVPEDVRRYALIKAALIEDVDLKPLAPLYVELLASVDEAATPLRAVLAQSESGQEILRIAGRAAKG